MGLFGKKKNEPAEDRFPENLRRFDLLDHNFQDTVNPHMMRLHRDGVDILYVVDETKERINPNFKPNHFTWYRRI